MKKDKDKNKCMELPDIQNADCESEIENADKLILTKINQREEENQALKKILENLNSSTPNVKKKLQ